MPDRVISVNRAPVLTLWAAVVAARQGYDWSEALTLGKALAGLNAQSKGRRLGIYGPPKQTAGGRAESKASRGEEFWVEVVGRPVPAKRTEAGVRAVVGDKPIDPAEVQRYLERKLGEHYQSVRNTLEALAASVDPQTLSQVAYEWYQTFRPQIPAGKRGWGAAGELDLGLIRRLAKAASRRP